MSEVRIVVHRKAFESMSTDNEYIDDLNKVLNDRYQAEDLCEILGLTLDDLFYKFTDEVLEVDWSEIL